MGRATRNLEMPAVFCHFPMPMSHADHPPELPEITDEAGNTPRWVPLLGLVLFVAMVAYVWCSHRTHEALEASTPTAAQAE